MKNMTEIESATAWGWALEIIASSKNVPISLLHDLISQIPPNLPDDLRRSVSERVALRCLEDLFAAHDAPPVRRSKLSLDFSESCQEVLKRIVNETAESDVRMGGGKWKWDVEPFIKHKKGCMPKCALSKLKDLVVDGRHPYAELFGRRSGLASVKVDGSDDVLLFNAGCSDAKSTSVEEERNVESALHSKRSRSVSETEKSGGGGGESYVDDGSRVNAKKAKRDGSYGLQSVGRDMLEESLRRDFSVSGREKCVLSEFQMDLREGSCGLEDDHDDYTVSKRSGDAICKSCAENPSDDKAKDGSGCRPESTTSGVAPPNERQHGVSAKDSCCYVEHEIDIEVPHPVSVGGSKQKSIADQGKDDSEHCPELTTLRVAPPDKAQQKVSAKESDQNNEFASHINITRPASEDVSQKKTIADGVKDHSCLDYVAMEKRDFLSSKSTSTRYFYSTQKDHCLMCNGGGQLLICTTSDCPMVYHESCMGSKFISYESGDFYCPFCAYSLHLMEFLEVEKEASRLRKDLYTFICVLGAS